MRTTENPNDPKAVINEDLITQALRLLDYKRVKRFVYKASWASSDVEHFLYLDTYGPPGHPGVNLTADFGFRNPQSEEFSVKCVKEYGGTLYQVLRHNPLTDCKMRFSFANLHDPQKRWAILIPKISPIELAQQFSQEVRDVVLPVVRAITTLRGLHERLLSDQAPCGWLMTNGAIRAANIIDLSKRLSFDENTIRASLAPHSRWIEKDLAKNAGISAQEYIESVISAWNFDKLY